MGLSSFCSFDFVLFWVNLYVVEFWLKSDSGLIIISKAKMLLQQTFLLKKKYSKGQLGCRYSSVDLSAPSILPPQVQVPSMSSMLLSFIVIVQYLSCEKKEK